LDVTERVVNSIVSLRIAGQYKNQTGISKRERERASRKKQPGKRYSEVMRKPLVIFAVERKQSR
jgi:hypothetical protein